MSLGFGESRHDLGKRFHAASRVQGIRIFGFGLPSLRVCRYFFFFLKANHTSAPDKGYGWNDLVDKLFGCDLVLVQIRTAKEPGSNFSRVFAMFS